MYIINATPYFPVPSFYLSIATPSPTTHKPLPHFSRLYRNWKLLNFPSASGFLELFKNRGAENIT
jgi:hypothetical protein